jgi:rhodanese-related sulfurtransferase
LPIYRSACACRALRADPPPQVIDIRSRAEWLQGHLPGTVSMPLLELKGQTASIDSSKPILVYSQEEYRAMIAASILLRERACDIGILTDSVQACSILLETPRNEQVESISELCSANSLTRI